MGKKKKFKFGQFLGKNWDILLIYLSITLGFGFSAICASDCSDAWGCIGCIVFILCGLALAAFCGLITILRTIVYKMNYWRLAWVIVPALIVAVMYLTSLTGG